MEQIIIGGKPHKVSQAVREHIEWLLIQIQGNKAYAQVIETKVEELREIINEKLSSIDSVVDRIKKPLIENFI